MQNYIIDPLATKFEALAFRAQCAALACYALVWVVIYNIA